MRKRLTLLVLVLGVAFCRGQKTSSVVTNPAFDRTIRSYLNFSVPILACTELEANMTNFTVLDAREEEEYVVSHIPGAQHIGFKAFDLASLRMPKDQPILVYCSIGYRSEKIGERLQEAGYTKVYNLYGSIFEWANLGFPLVDTIAHRTDRIHTYSRKWSKWVEADIEKVW